MRNFRVKWYHFAASALSCIASFPPLFWQENFRQRKSIASFQDGTRYVFGVPPKTEFGSRTGVLAGFGRSAEPVTGASAVYTGLLMLALCQLIVDLRMSGTKKSSAGASVQ